MVKTLKAEKCMKQNYKVISPEDSISKAVSMLDGSADVLLVFEKNKYLGVITERMALRSGNDDKAKVKAVMSYAPKIEKTTTIPECARLMIENNLMTLPVFEKNKVVGVVDDDSLLAAVATKKFGNRKAIEFMSGDLAVAAPKDKIAKVLWMFREHHISRMPIVENNRLVGIVTLHDVLSKSKDEKKGYGFITGEKETMLDLPVEDIMSVSLVTAKEDEPIKNIIAQLVDNSINSVIITGPGERLSGMITRKDLLEPLLAEAASGKIPKVQISSKLDVIDRKELAKEVEIFTKKYSMKDAMAYMYLSRHKESRKGQNLIFVRMRLTSPKGKYNVTAEGWGTDVAVKNALLKLEKMVLRDMNHKKLLMDYVDITSL